MRTIIIIFAGFLLFAACVGATWLLGNNTATATSTAVKVFIAIWFFAAAVNMWVGVTRAGYSFMEELPIFLLIFALPASVALLIQWKLS